MRGVPSISGLLLLLLFRRRQTRKFYGDLRLRSLSFLQYAIVSVFLWRKKKKNRKISDKSGGLFIACPVLCVRIYTEDVAQGRPRTENDRSRHFFDVIV